MSRPYSTSLYNWVSRQICLKLYCRYLYTRPCMINHIQGSKTTMTSGEWTCLISFATAPLTCSERGGSEKIQNENIFLQRIRTHAPPVHDMKVAALQTARPRGLDGDQWLNVQQDNGIQILKNCYVTTRVNLIMVTRVFELKFRLSFHFLSHCRFQLV